MCVWILDGFQISRNRIICVRVRWSLMWILHPLWKSSAVVVIYAMSPYLRLCMPKFTNYIVITHCGNCVSMCAFVIGYESIVVSQNVRFLELALLFNWADKCHSTSLWNDASELHNTIHKITLTCKSIELSVCSSRVKRDPCWRGHGCRSTRAHGLD